MVRKAIPRVADRIPAAECPHRDHRSSLQDAAMPTSRAVDSQEFHKGAVLVIELCPVPEVGQTMFCRLMFIPTWRTSERRREQDEAGGCAYTQP